MNMKLSKFFITALLALPLAAIAGEWGLQVHVSSVHFQQRAGAAWNEGNDGFALRYAFDETHAVQAGHYRNEQGVQGFNFFTNYALMDYTPVHAGPLRFGVFGGIVSGFDRYTLQGSHITSVTEAGLNAVAGLVARYRFGAFNVTLRAQPDIPGAGAAAVAAEVGFSF